MYRPNALHCDAADEGPERMREMESALSRSITLVVWYKPNGEPLRLHHEVTTFPLFQLSHFPALVSDLGLSPTSYIDVYNPAARHFEQHLPTTVCTVVRGQRLLYKLRRSLLDGLTDAECVGLHEELQMQHGVKRPAEDVPEEAPAQKYRLTDMYAQQPMAFPHALASPGTATSPIAGPSTPSSSSPSTSSASTYLHHPTAPQHQPTPPTMFAIPYHPHPPLKRWPNDYSVSELSAGFAQVDVLAARTTQRAAFERVFGCRYVKSTVCRHRGVWRRAGPEMRARFEVLGTDERAMWGEFVRAVEGRPPGKAGSASLVDDQLQYPVHEEQRDEDEDIDERGQSATGSLDPPPHPSIDTTGTAAQ
ncbi:hypothetical protein PLICRDRAFT_241976 [Plicaturopsis crispa FD-325 SS-3]|nr:hypothetical protein PLICRDRAFT_241976 [Plicaturopsis crispa FD-325 SS-3]